VSEKKVYNIDNSSLHSVTSGMSSRTSSPIHVGVTRFGPGAENSGLLSDTSEAETPTRGALGIGGQQTQLSKHQFIVAATVHMEEAKWTNFFSFASN